MNKFPISGDWIVDIIVVIFLCVFGLWAAMMWAVSGIDDPLPEKEEDDVSE